MTEPEIPTEALRAAAQALLEFKPHSYREHHMSDDETAILLGDTYEVADAVVVAAAPYLIAEGRRQAAAELSMPSTPDSRKPLDLDEIRDQLAESSGIIDHPDAPYNWAALSAQRVAERLLAEVERLHTWAGLMSLVDEHYPTSVFPVGEDDPTRDLGPRILSLIRHLDHARSSEAAAHKALGELSGRYSQCNSSKGTKV